MATGIWKNRPKANISLMTSERYSETLASSLDRQGAGLAFRPRRAGRLEGHEKLPGERHDRVIDHRSAGEEQYRRCRQIGQEGLLLAAVEAGRDEAPELVRDHWEGEEQPGIDADLDIDEERLVEPR